MTIKRQWMLVLVLVAILTVAINSFVLSALINRYFVSYTAENYDRNLGQIVELSKKALANTSYSKWQLEMQLENHLNEPINGIQLYDAQGFLVAEASNRVRQPGGMMRNRMMDRMMGSQIEQKDSVEISDNGNLLGQLLITRYGSVGNSLVTRRFTVALIGNSLLSVGIVLVLVLVIGFLVSKRMSKDLQTTAQLAVDIDLGNQFSKEKSKVVEIRTIQQSLEALQARLRLKQTSRKKLVDELVHQTRTPLTILKTHLEGIEDGVITVTPEEIKTCEAQIESIEAIISNMSKMIDAEQEIDTLQISEFELNYMIRQIIGGLKVQFDKKGIELKLLEHGKVYMKTDKYKLSQCVYNLLTNAYKFTDQQGSVFIDYNQIGNEVTIFVEDSGAGISAEDKEHLFEAYFRGENASGSEGDGIGLYVVRENLNRINGRIEVESTLGKGSRFIMVLPTNTGMEDDISYR